MTSAVIDTAIIFTSRMEALAAFYRAAFDLGEPKLAPGHIGFRMENLYLGFDQIDAEGGGAGGISLWFRVDDLEKTFARVVSLGAKVRYGPMLKGMGDRLASVYDLDGNTIGISQRKDKTASG